MGKMSDARQEIIEIFTAFPGSTSRDVGILMPHVPFGTVASIISIMKAEGVLEVDGKKDLSTTDGKVRPITAYRLSDNPVPKPLAPKIKLKKPTEAGYEARIAAFQAQIAELEAWKAAAIERFPDLAVPPVVARARKLVAAEVRAGGDNVLADQIIAGHKDSTLMVRVAIKALEDA